MVRGCWERYVYRWINCCHRGSIWRDYGGICSQLAYFGHSRTWCYIQVGFGKPSIPSGKGQRSLLPWRQLLGNHRSSIRFNQKFLFPPHLYHHCLDSPRTTGRSIARVIFKVEKISHHRWNSSEKSIRRSVYSLTTKWLNSRIHHLWWGDA